MNILVTGGAGFIGSHLSARLVRRKDVQLSIADNLHPFYEISRKQEQLQAIRDAGQFRFIELDLANEEACKALFEANAFDTVVHLAAVPGVAPSLNDPQLYIDMNIKAAVNALKWAGETGVRHIVFASSSSVYGEQEHTRLSEDMASGNVVSPYAATKASAECFCQLYKHLYGYRMTILRFFTAYGPFGRPDLAIPKFINKLLRGEAIDIYSMDTARDYTFVDDVANGIMRAVDLPEEDGIYNIGSGQPVAMSTLLSELERHFPAMEARLLPRRAGDVTATWADIRKAAERLGYQPSTSFREGLAKTVAWERARYEQGHQ
ncbi:NAD-dependent epimerase/dehydratase family protein [Paenibacillus tarimensis]